MTDFELTRRHYVYTFDATSEVTVTNDTKGIKLNRLWGVWIKRKKTIRMQELKGHISNITITAYIIKLDLSG